MGKKRKQDYAGLDEVCFSSLFSRAANSISHLYTEGLKHQKRAYNAGARANTEKVLNFVLNEYSGQTHVPTSVLVEVLRHELEELADEDASLSGGGLGNNAASGGGGAIGQHQHQPPPPQQQQQGGGSGGVGAFGAKGYRAQGSYTTSPMKSGPHHVGQPLWQQQPGLSAGPGVTLGGGEVQQQQQQQQGGVDPSDGHTMSVESEECGGMAMDGR